MIEADLDRVDGFSEFMLEAANGACSATQQFYAQRDRFTNFANQLKDFPENIKSRVKLNIGGEEKIWATYLHLEVFCYEPSGKSAIKVIMETRAGEPYYNKAEFFITCYPAFLNKLGETLRNWKPLEVSTFEWQAE